MHACRPPSSWQTLREPKFNKWPDLLTLYDLQQDWVGADAPGGQLGSVKDACGLPRLYLHVQENNDKFEQSVAGNHDRRLMDVDVCHWLMQGPVKGAGGRPDSSRPGLLLLCSDVPARRVAA